MVEATSEYSSDQDASDESEATSSDEGAEDSDSDLPRNEFGTVVHRILEFDRPQSEWSTLARRIAAVNGFDVTERTVEDVVEHAVDAKEFLDAEAAAYENSGTYEELSVSVDVGNFQIVGDIDHLRVTPEAFVITDYKTNRLGTRTPEELAEPLLCSLAEDVDSDTVNDAVDGCVAEI